MKYNKLFEFIVIFTMLQKKYVSTLSFSQMSLIDFLKE